MAKEASALRLWQRGGFPSSPAAVGIGPGRGAADADGDGGEEERLPHRQNQRLRSTPATQHTPDADKNNPPAADT